MFSTSLQCDRNADNSSSSKHQFSFNSSTFPWTTLASSVSTTTSSVYKCTNIAAAHRITKIAFFLLHRPNISSGFMQNRSIVLLVAVLNYRFTRFPVYSLLFALPLPPPPPPLSDSIIFSPISIFFLPLPPRSQNSPDSIVQFSSPRKLSIILLKKKRKIYIRIYI